MRLAFVAEAPGVEEVSAGQPLVGPSGRVFNAMLRSANIEREEVYIGNVFNEKADDNDVSAWMKDPVRVAEMLARLNEELTAVQPTVIVPLGGTALWAFTEQTLISKYRGAATRATRIMPGAKLIPTFHPANVLRSWHALPIAVGDIMKAQVEADVGPAIVYPKVELYIEPTLADVFAYEAEALAAPKLSVDIETGWGQIRSIAYAVSTSRAFDIPLIDLRRPDKSYWPDAATELAVWGSIKRVLESSVPKVGQNYMYDIFWLWEKYGIGTRNYRSDTRLRHKVLFPELPADLASMGATYTRLGSWKMWGGKYQNAVEKRDA